MDRILDNEIMQGNRSHSKDSLSLGDEISNLRNKIVSRGDLPHISVKDQLVLLDRLSEFPFGQYLIERKGANGFWTDYLIFHSHKKLVVTADRPSNRTNIIEDFFFNRSPLVLAHRERVCIYQTLMQEKLKEGITIASIPCGVMRDLLILDFSNISRFQLVGLDIDQESLNLARRLAQEQGIMNVDFLQQDAWQMTTSNEFDIISSSGLNVYEPDPEKVLDLYRRFYAALKPGGFLIISALTYPPGELKKTDWILENIPPDDLLMENTLCREILGLYWRNFRSADELDKEFKEVGFCEIRVYFDRCHIFPTILARK